MIATCVPAITRSTLSSSTEAFKTAAKLGTEYLTTTPPWRLGPDALRWWQVMTDRKPPRWAHPNEVLWESGVSRLRDFSQGSTDDVVPTLVLPPQAGHDSCIVDYSVEQSQMKVLHAAGLTKLYSMDWIGATDDTKHSGVEDYIADLDRAWRDIAPAGGKMNLVGDCQGGWFATIYAALHPERVNTLTVAGAPIDFHGDAEIARYVELLDPSVYVSLVAAHGGVMRGEYLLGGFITMRPENEIGRQLELLKHLDDAEHLERYAEFEDWFKHTQAVPGTFYLWIVEQLFRRNGLVNGTVSIRGQKVDLSRIDCPLFLLAGQKDHITPPAQVWALADAASTPADKVERRLTTGGHLGLFMGREALRDHWPELMSGVYAESVRDPHRAEAKHAAEQAAPDRPPAIVPGY
jgi:poly(3-hydroxybutyrate) depolymerase